MSSMRLATLMVRPPPRSASPDVGIAAAARAGARDAHGADTAPRRNATMYYPPARTAQSVSEENKRRKLECDKKKKAEEAIQQNVRASAPPPAVSCCRRPRARAVRPCGD